MGSLSYCYKEFMIEYILINVRLTKYERIYTDEYLRTLSERELENLVRCFNRTYKSYGAFAAGLAVTRCTDKWSESCDMLNASMGAIGDFMGLVGIYEPNVIDFEEE